jgi:hypothetical protein
MFKRQFVLQKGGRILRFLKICPTIQNINVKVHITTKVNLSSKTNLIQNQNYSIRVHWTYNTKFYRNPFHSLDTVPYGQTEERYVGKSAFRTLLKALQKIFRIFDPSSFRYT